MNDRAPLLSIVTATYNDAGGLSRTLNSVALQTSGTDRVELVIVDGGSTDATSAVVASHDRLRPIFISEPDEGVYDAMNKGWQRCSGRFVQFLNAGDTFANGSSLAALLKALECGDPSWLVAGAVHLNGGHGPPTLINNLPHVWWRHAAGLQPACHQSTVFARTVLEALGGYSLEFDFVADFDLILRCGLIAAPLEIHQTLVVYEGGGMSAQRHHEISMLLHRVRVSRLSLTGGALRWDLLWTRCRESRMRFAQLRLTVASRPWLRRKPPRSRHVRSGTCSLEVQPPDLPTTRTRI